MAVDADQITSPETGMEGEPCSSLAFDRLNSHPCSLILPRNKCAWLYLLNPARGGRARWV